MRKIYELPEINFIAFAQKDILTMSQNDNKDNIADDIFG